LSPVAVAGTIGVAWDPVPGASGYRLSFGTASGQYSQTIDTAGVTGHTFAVNDCTTYYVAVKAYNQHGESPAYSDELDGWAALRLESVSGSTFRQGDQPSFMIQGANLPQDVVIDFGQDDADGDPLVSVAGTPAVTCHRVDSSLDVAGVRGERAAEVGTHTFRLRSGGRVIGTGSYQVLFDEERLDINRSDSQTRDRVDGKDLVWLAYSHATAEGDPRYNPDADLNGDGAVDGEDLAYLATGFGSCWDGSAWSLEACP
jgi:hypothetical protein